MNNNPYARHRFPAEIISQCVWLYNSFSLSLRDIEKMMLYRGVEVTYESIRDWVNKFSLPIAKKIRTNRRKSTDKWHLDEVRIVIKGVVHWLWRAVDSEGQVLDILIQKRRNKKAAKRLLKKLLKKQKLDDRRVILSLSTFCDRSLCSAKTKMNSNQHLHHKIYKMIIRCNFG